VKNIRTSLLVLATALPIATASGPAFAILGGADAPFSSHPSELALQRLSGSSWSHLCGAVLVGSQTVLTSAHCVDGASVSGLRIVAGMHDRSDLAGGQIAGVQSYAMHPQYGVVGKADIAIIYLASAVSFDTGVQPAAILSKSCTSLVGRNAKIRGWGLTSSANVLPNVLQEAILPIISTSQARQLTASVGGASWHFTDETLAYWDSAGQKGSSYGDTNVYLADAVSPGGNEVIAGLTSVVISNAGGAMPSYPQAATCTGSNIGWLASNIFEPVLMCW
jgi:Trypsin